VSVTLYGLVPAALHTLPLFDAPGQVKTALPLRDRTRLNAAMDRINKTYGKNALYFASAHGALNEAPMRIAFNRIPDIETER